MQDIKIQDKNKLFKQVRTLLGAPLREVELDNDTLDTLLEVAIEDFSGFINDWLIQQQWGMLQNLSLDKTELVFALTTKTLDFEKSFSYAYSKQAGLGTNSVWELKKDYVTISANTQYYTIPAGREVNEVLWYTPPQINSFGYDTLANNGWSFSNFGWNFMGTPAQAVLPAYNMVLFTQDINMKKHILQSQLTYKITAGPSGTKILHLYPVPGSRDEIRGKDPKHYEGSKVWYWYYETEPNNRDKCIEENSDIIKLPSDIPINSLSWNKLNDPSRVRVRRLLISKCKNFIGLNRGKFSGDLKGRDGEEMKMDYSMYLEQAKSEEDGVYEDLKVFLEKITYRQLMEDKANIAENLNTVLKYVPAHHNIIFY